MSTHTIGIAVDSAPAQRGVEDLRADVAKLRDSFSAAESRAEAFNAAVASMKRAAYDDLADSLKGVAEAARGATTEVRKLAAEMQAVAKMKVSGFLTDQRERVAGLIADLRAVALAADTATAGMTRFADQTRRAVVEGGRLQAVQARPSQLSGSSPQQIRLAGPSQIIDIQPINSASSAFQRLRDVAASAYSSMSGFVSNAFASSFQRIRDAAASVGSALQRFGADQSGALSLQRIGELARGAGAALATLASNILPAVGNAARGVASGGFAAMRIAAAGALGTLGIAALATVGPIAAIAGASVATAYALGKLGQAGAWAFNAIGGVARNIASFFSPITSAIGSVWSALSSFASGVAGLLSPVFSAIGKIGSGLLAAAGAGALGFAALAKSALETADSFTLFERKLSTLSNGVTSEASRMRADIFGIADATRSTVDQSANDFTRFHQVLSPLGATIGDVTALVTGAGAAMKLGGTSTEGASRAMTQFFQIAAKGKADIGDLKSIQQQAPALARLIEEAYGKPLMKIHEEAKKGPKEAQAVWSKVFSFVAQQAPILQQQLAQMPRTMSEAIQQLKTEWFRSVGEMQKNSDFMGPVLATIDRIKAIIAGDAFKQGFGYILQTVTSTAEQLVRWISSGETIGATFNRVSLHFKNIGAYAKAALNDIAAIAKSKLPGWMGGEEAGASQVGQLKADIDKQIATQFAADRKNPWQGAITGDPLAVAKARTDDGLDEIRKKLTDFDAKLAWRFDDAAAASQKAALVASAENAAKDASIAMTRAAESGFTGFDASITRPLNQAAEKLAVFREQLQTNTVNPAAFTSAKSAIDDLATASANAEGRLGELKKVRDEALGKGDVIGAGLATVALDEYGKHLDTLKANLREGIALKQAFENGDFSKLGTPEAAKPGANKFKTPVPAATKTGGNGGDTFDSMVEKLQKLKEQVSLEEALISGDEKRIANARMKLEIESQLTAKMRAQHPVLASLIEAEIRRKAELQKQVEVFNTWKSVGEQASQTLFDNFMKVGEGAMSFKDALKQSLVQLIKLVAQAAILKPLMNSIGNGFGAGGASIFGGGGAGSMGGIFSLFGFANGGAFDGGIRYYANGGTFGGNGSIVSSPTAFMGGGKLSVAGESGPEGILPLTRMPGGKLGVQAKGGSGAGGNVHVNTTINVGGDATEATVEKMRGMVQSEIAMATPGLTKRAVSAVRRENTDNGHYLKR